MTAFVLASILSFAAAEAQDGKRFDGHWWRSAPYGERRGFLSGYIDCYKYEFKGRANFSVKSGMELEELISSFYQANPREILVSRVLYRFRAEPGERAPEGGEVWEEAHGYYDGIFWKQIDEPRRLGFIEGYLWCYSEKAGNPHGTFSKDARHYVSLITEWYRLDDNTGDIDPDREEEKIANVLYKFVDQKCEKGP